MTHHASTQSKDSTPLCFISNISNIKYCFILGILAIGCAKPENTDSRLITNSTDFSFEKTIGFSCPDGYFLYGLYNGRTGIKCINIPSDTYPWATKPGWYLEWPVCKGKAYGCSLPCYDIV